MESSTKIKTVNSKKKAIKRMKSIIPGTEEDDKAKGFSKKTTMKEFKLPLFKEIINSKYPFEFNLPDHSEEIKEKYLYIQEEMPKQEEIEEIDDKEDNYDSETDQQSVILFDSDIYFLKTVKAVDVVFLVDTTGSMNPYIKGIRHFLRKMLYEIKKCILSLPSEEIDILKVGLVSYRDHEQKEPSYVSKVISDLTLDTAKIKEEIMNLTAFGGADEPEAVLDGINDVVNSISWRENSFKLLYHVIDAPPHGRDLNGGLKDNYTQGCPCGIKYRELLYDLRGKGIEYTIVSIGDHLDKMIDAFKTVMKLELMCPTIKADPKKKNTQINNSNIE